MNITIKTITTTNVTLLKCVQIVFCVFVAASPVPSGTSIDRPSSLKFDNRGLIDIGNYLSIKESKKIRIKKELEMPGSSGGRREPIPDIENGKNNERNRQLSLRSHKSLRFEVGINLEDASDEVGIIFIHFN